MTSRTREAFRTPRSFAWSSMCLRATAVFVPRRSVALPRLSGATSPMPKSPRANPKMLTRTA
eukprot:3055793-Alexandrium_andersonii.AAC.1